MKIRLLHAGRLPAELDDRLGQAYDMTVLAGEPDRAAYLAAHGSEFEAVATSAAIGVGAALIGALPLRTRSGGGDRKCRFCQMAPPTVLGIPTK
jgi:hypothetical protein